MVQVETGERGPAGQEEPALVGEEGVEQGTLEQRELIVGGGHLAASR